MSFQLRKIPKYSELYINPDLTPAEREANRKLRQELAQRRAAGEEDIVIRNGTIIKRPNGTRTRPPFQGSRAIAEVQQNKEAGQTGRQ